MFRRRYRDAIEEGLEEVSRKIRKNRQRNQRPDVLSYIVFAGIPVLILAVWLLAGRNEK